MATKQTNIVANPARTLIFFEGEDLAYNYKTDQWSRVPAYDTYGMYSINDKDKDIGLVVYSSGSVDLQDQATSDPDQDATIATGSLDLNPGGRAIINGVRPLYAGGGTITAQGGSQDSVNDSIDWSTATSLNSRTGFANVRKEGRYQSALVKITGGFTALIGADIDFSPTGRS